jgi:hypothetical protein
MIRRAQVHLSETTTMRHSSFHPNRNRASRPRRLWIELLESRTLLAGNVTVNVVGGSLIITGDDLDNRFIITQFQRPPGEFLVGAQGVDTTFNGQPNFVANGVTKDIRISTLGGNDSVSLVDAQVPGSLLFDGGAGDDDLVGRLVSRQATEIGKHLTVTNGDGQDKTQFESCTIRGNATVTNGAGGSTTEFKNCQVGSLSIQSDAGADEVEVSATIVRKNLTVRSGDGDTEVDIEGTRVNGTTILESREGFDDIDLEDNTIFNKKVVLMLGNGGSQTTMEQTTFRKGFFLQSLTGVDELVIDSILAEGPVNVSTGDGSDFLRVDSPTAAHDSEAGHSIFRKPVNLDAGGDDDQLLVGVAGQPNDAADFLSSLVGAGGPGNDLVDAAADNGNVFAKTPQLTGFETIVP